MCMHVFECVGSSLCVCVLALSPDQLGACVGLAWCAYQDSSLSECVTVCDTGMSVCDVVPSPACVPLSLLHTAAAALEGLGKPALACKYESTVCVCVTVCVTVCGCVSVCTLCVLLAASMRFPFLTHAIVRIRVCLPFHVCPPPCVCRSLERALLLSKSLRPSPVDPPDIIASSTRMCARALVRLRLSTPDARRVLERVRTSLSLHTTPLQQYLPRATVATVIGQLMAAPSPVAFVDGVVAALSRTGAQAHSQHTYADAVRTLLALVVL